jgi:hypothetical protein
MVWICTFIYVGVLGILLLCEVALGTTYNVYGAEYMEKPRPGTQSTFGMGLLLCDMCMWIL